MYLEMILFFSKLHFGALKKGNRKYWSQFSYYIRNGDESAKILSKPGPILESKGMCAIFQKKGTKRAKNVKKGKIFEKLGKNVQNLKNIFKKGR